MRYILSILLISSAFQLNAQNELWVDRVGTNGNNYVYNIKIDPSTNDCYATGRVKGIGTFGENTSNPQSPPVVGDRDAYLTKHDVNGELVWVKRFGGLYTDYGTAIELDDDYIYLSGYFTDTATIDNDTLIGAGSQDAYLIKLDKDGNVIWSKTWGGEGSDRIDEMILVGSEIYAVGFFEDSINFGGTDLINTVNPFYTNSETSFLVKLDTSGNVIWAEKQQSTRGVRPIDITYLDGYLYVVGNCYGSTEFGGMAFSSTNTVYYDQFVAKYKDDASFVNTTLYGNNWAETCTHVDVADNNTLLVTGYFKGVVSYGTDTYDVAEQTGIIFRIDTAANVLSSSPLESTEFSHLDALEFAGDRIYTGGYFDDTLIIMNDTLLSAGLKDIIYIEYDQDLNPIDYKTYGGVSADQIRCLHATDEGQLRLGGSFRVTVNFETVSYTTQTNTYDGLIMGYCPQTKTDASISDTSICLNETMVITNNYPLQSDIAIINPPIGGNINVVSGDQIEIDFSSAGVGSFDLEFSSHCEADTITINYEVFDVPTVSIGPDSSACDTINIVLNAIGLYDSIFWSTSLTNVDSLVVTSTGYYFAEVFNNDGCMAVDSAYIELIDCSTSIPEWYVSWLEDLFYFDKQIHFIFKSNIPDDVTYAIYNMSGDVIQEGNLKENTITISELTADGMYVLSIQEKNKNFSFKFIKN